MLLNLQLCNSVYSEWLLLDGSVQEIWQWCKECIVTMIDIVILIDKKRSHVITTIMLNKQINTR